MKNKISYLLFAISLLTFAFSIFFSFTNSKGNTINKEDYFPSSTLKFEENYIKTKKNEKVVLKIKGGEKDKVKYTISDATKIKIVSSSHLGVIVERISDYKDEVFICALNKEYEELNDICYISCYNELLSCDDIYLYKIGLNDENKDTTISVGNGTYCIEFLTSKIDDNIKMEEESKKELQENLEEFFGVEIKESSAKRLEICFEINIETKKVFAYEIRKTMSFKIDRANFIYTLQKAI